MRNLLATLATAASMVAYGLCDSPNAVQTMYGQCGGKTWTGPTACPTGAVCSVGNEWFYQCLSSGGGSSSGDAPLNNGGNDNNNNNNQDCRGGWHGRWGRGGRWGGGCYRGGRGSSTPAQTTARPTSVSGGNGGNGGYGGDHGDNSATNSDGDVVVTQTITTIFNVGPTAVTTPTTIITAPQGPQVTVYVTN
ncbi:Cellulose-binding domain protein [Niveomyces insectorum RCEF 264]|uniref:Cellulose-binding domain protein n=1 Tax=Niveomyces insectorum RCEF 264 TaxID=1081102 RepID=A0A167QWG1_9HYPO|nr:Cellulose-binding domain protein [Niveomyces insectorum RCEF 264]